MPLAAGSRIGPYAIVSPLGAGGMGEVYRARDTQLGREVALKVLPAAFAADAERMARFQREAQVLASLNHPNIAAIYGLETGTAPPTAPKSTSSSESSGSLLSSPPVKYDPLSADRALVYVGEPPALVMELVEGPTLADLIRKANDTASRPSSRNAAAGSGAGRASLDSDATAGSHPNLASAAAATASSLAAPSFPLEDALPIARQIAEALEAAHDRGIIHRDLKPANVKIRPDGVVKVLDFGLAKAIEGDPSSSDLQNSPTLTAMTTMAGVILGTAAYMSPEQAKGKQLDRRTDIWSFGCVLYETLCGKQAFTGETSSDILAAVIRGEPEWSALPSFTPPRIIELIHRCLQKEPKQRLQAIGEARIAIEQVISGAGDTALGAASGAGTQSTLNAPQQAASSTTLGAAGTGTAQKPRSSALAWIVAAACAIAALGLAANYFLHPPQPMPTIISTIAPPPDHFFTFAGNLPGPPVLSPDGSRIAFSAVNKDGEQTLWVRALNSPTATELAGTSGARNPFWSPDSRSIAFFTFTKLSRVDAAGGPITPLGDTQADGARGGSWGASGTIVFSSSLSGGLSAVADTGGATRVVTNMDESKDETNHRWPQFLPDGKHFLFFGHGRTAGTSSVYVGSLDGAAPKVLFRNESSAVFAAPGYLLFGRQAALMAQRFDLKSLSTVGEAVAIANHAEVNPIIYVSTFSASENGLLSYIPGDGSMGDAQLSIFDRSGKRLSNVGDPGEFLGPSLSPNGDKLAVSVDSGGGGTEIWIFDLLKAIKTRVTFDPSVNQFTNWSADEKYLAFSFSRDSNRQILVQPADGATQAVAIGTTTTGKAYAGMSWNAGILAYSVGDYKGSTNYQLLTQPVAGGNSASDPFHLTGEPKVVVSVAGNAVQPALSPDGKWLAYASNETGRFEVYIVPAKAAGGGKWQVSSNGGNHPVWPRSGKELFFRANDTNKVMVAEIVPSGAAVQVANLRPVFPDSNEDKRWAAFSVGPDGKTFAAIDRATQTVPVPVVLITNWTSLIKPLK